MANGKSIVEDVDKTLFIGNGYLEWNRAYITSNYLVNTST